MYLGTQFFFYFAEVLNAVDVLPIHNARYVQNYNRLSTDELIDQLFLYTKEIVLNVMVSASHKRVLAVGTDDRTKLCLMVQSVKSLDVLNRYSGQLQLDLAGEKK